MVRLRARHHDLAAVYGDAPIACEATVAYFGQQMRALDRALADGRQTIMGESFTAADILLSTCLTWATRYGVPISDTAQAYNDRMTRRPALAEASVRNTNPSSPQSQGAGV